MPVDASHHMQPRYPAIRCETSYEVTKSDLDAAGRFNPVRWIALFQEIAIQHARLLKVSLEELQHARYSWVLSGMSLWVGAQPPGGSSMRLMTWPSGFERLIAGRSFLVIDNNDRVCAAGESDWLIINVESRRPARLEQFVREIHVPDGVTQHRVRRLPAPRSPEFGGIITVDKDDIDLNGHVNNTRYVAWLLDHPPPGIRESASLSGMEINYLAESLAGDRLTAGWMRTGETELLHSIRRIGDNREIVRACTSWAENTTSSGAAGSS